MAGVKTGRLLIALVTASILRAEDMQNYLSKTEELVRAGKYEEALERHIWFHDHALEHNEGMYGVRLSFALGNWKELGDTYPPAREALVGTRDRKAKALLEGDESFDLFHDVESINQALGEDGKTVTLFEKLHEEQPEVAKTYWRLAKDAVIAAKRYDLVRVYLGSPGEEFERVKASYEMQFRFYDDPRIGGDRFKAFNEGNFVKESLQLIEIASALGKPESAREIQAKAFAVLPDPRLRDAIDAGDTEPQGEEPR